MIVHQGVKQRKEGRRDRSESAGKRESKGGERRMEALLSLLQRYSGLAVVAFAVAFRCVHHLLRNLPVPKVVKNDEFRFWKWRNLSVSLVHSLLTGVWAVTW